MTTVMDEADYKPLSPLAVVSLAAGCFSTLALVSSSAWALPLVGVGLAVAALADIRRSDGRKAGRLAALAGLALAVGCGTQAVSAALVSQWIASGRAAATAGMWVDAVREGRLDDAMRICLPTALPAPGDQPPAGDTRPDAAFSALPAVRALRACASTRPVIGSATRGDGDASRWTVKAGLAACGGDLENAAVRITVSPRIVTGPGGMVDRWMVTGFEIDH